ASATATDAAAIMPETNRGLGRNCLIIFTSQVCDFGFTLGYQMSSLDMLATWPLLASITTLYSAAGGLKAYIPCASVRPLANTLSLFSSTSFTGIPRAIWPPVNRNLHTTSSVLIFLHWIRSVEALRALGSDNATKTAASLIADFMSVPFAEFRLLTFLRR